MKIARSRIAAAGLLGLALGSHAAAQNALDADLYAYPSPLPGGVNPLVEGENFTSRNRLVTGNVMGGRGFRGVAGYTAAEDFRVDEGDYIYGTGVGSDEFHDFLAGSAWSDVSFISLGSTYNRLRYGQQIGLVEFGYDRTSASPDATNFSGSSINPSAVFSPVQRMAERMRLDQLNQQSSSMATSLLSAEPVTAGRVATEEDGEQVLGLSSLRGVTAVQPDQDVRVIGLTTWDRARLEEDYGNGLGMLRPGEAYQTTFQQALAERPVAGRTSVVEGQRRDSRIDLTTEGYRAVLQEIADRYARLVGEPEDPDAAEAPRPSYLADIDADLEALRRRLAGLPGGEVPGPVEPAPPAAGDDPAARVLPDRPGPGELATILRHGQRIGTLSAGDASRFDELMRQAEGHFKSGEYFRAENDFNRALRFSPGHPLATAGLAHAQIGAGLYVPAATTLRGLLTFHPEMIDVRYDRDLLPTRPRLSRAIEEIQGRLGEDRHRANLALLLAYVGRLIEDDAVLRQGLSLMRAAAPDDPLLPIIDRIWSSENPAP